MTTRLLLLSLLLSACRLGEAPAAAPEAPPKKSAPRIAHCSVPGRYLLGAAVSDVTGPAAETRMFGYAELTQQTMGIHSRLKSRAFVIADPCSGERLAFVSADLLSITQAVKREVTRRVRAQLGEAWREENLLLTATHTHSAPGGYSHYLLYNLTILGFDPKNFEAVVAGIVESIVQADAALRPGKLRVAKGELIGASINRSPKAYALNPAEERARYPEDVDTQMTLLRLDGEDGVPIGVIDWFAVHTTSMGPTHRLISSDNKGWASDHFERSMRTRWPLFVAAFANSNEGDSSPNIHGGMEGEGKDDFESTAASGKRQLDFALALFEAADRAQPLTGPIELRHAYVKFDGLRVDPRWTDGVARTTCPAALGLSMIAGAEDGPGYGAEGTRCDALSKVIPGGLACKPFKRECQAEKPVLLEMGTRLPYPWTPEVLPLQLVRIGSLALVAAPFELTTMSGRRLREMVASVLAPAGVSHVVLAGLANSYAGYVATREEYALQHYEGASTHFGPWTLAALQQEFFRLAEALRDGAPVNPGPTPRDLSGVQHTIQTSVVFDDTPPGVVFGQVHRDVAPQVSPGALAWASFWGAHPKNDFRRNGSFLYVEREVAGAWEPIATDADWATRFHWVRGACLGCSQVSAEWHVPEDAAPGRYRFRIGGEWKSLYGGIRSYEGVSSSFVVRGEQAAK